MRSLTAASRVAVGAALAAAVAVPLGLSAGPASASSAPINNCPFSHLSISEGHSGAAAGHYDVTIQFTDTDVHRCSLHGYPDVVGIGTGGYQYTEAEQTRRGFTGGLPSGDSIPTVVLHQGQTATARLEGTDVPADGHSSCPQLSAIVVKPPQDSKIRYFSDGLQVCSPIEVHPVLPGTTGTES